MPARVFLLAISLFIVYGSLFPFDFASQPLPLESFFAEHELFANRSDAIDNFFLFVPLGVALHMSFAKPAGRVLGAILSVLLLAVGIQLIQLYLPSRTASVSDAFWNTAGMLAGLVVAARVRKALGSQLAARAAGRDNFLLCLVVLWFCYESFPFVPTLDVGLLRNHVKTVVFAPPFDPMRLLQHGLAAALAAIAAMRAGWLRRPAVGLASMGALALTLEVCVAYGSLRRETLLGIVLGLGLGYFAAARLRGRVATLALVMALCALLITVLTPYRGQALAPGFTLTPFSHLLWNGALRELPPAAFEALAIGTLLWAGLALGARPWGWCALALVLLAVLEWVRVALAGYHGDTTALVMALVLAPAAAALRGAPGADADDVRAESRGAASAAAAAPASPAPSPRSALAPAACACAGRRRGIFARLAVAGRRRLGGRARGAAA
jgi:VanZ family protein